MTILAFFISFTWQYPFVFKSLIMLFDSQKLTLQPSVLIQNFINKNKTPNGVLFINHRKKTIYYLFCRM